MNNLDSTYLREVLEYDQNTGIFTWKIKPSQAVKVNDIAGTKKKDGYVEIQIKKKLYKASRLAWLYVYEEWPKKFIDHKNGIRHDNRIINLRDVSRQENIHNQRKAQSDNKSSGLIGVYPSNGTRWRAKIMVDKKSINLGFFATKEDAFKAYLDAKRKLHPTAIITAFS
jgi:hypothetical protein